MKTFMFLLFATLATDLSIGFLGALITDRRTSQFFRTIRPSLLSKKKDEFEFAEETSNDDAAAEASLRRKAASEKIDEWKELLRAGLLFSENGDLTEEKVKELDATIAAHKKKSSHLAHSAAADDIVQSMRGDVKREAGNWFDEKFTELTRSTEAPQVPALFAFLNEMKDKSANPSLDLLENILLSSCRRIDYQPSPLILRKMYQLCYSLNQMLSDGSKRSMEFHRKLGNLCFANNLMEFGEFVVSRLATQAEISSDWFLAGRLCGAIRNCKPLKSNHPRGREVSKLKEVSKILGEFLRKVNNCSIDEINMVIRMLGTRRMLSTLFAMLNATSSMPHCSKQQHENPSLGRRTLFQYVSTWRNKERILGKSFIHGFDEHEEKQPRKSVWNEETSEFVTNAIISTVDETHSVVKMKHLPHPNYSMPEVVLFGRSNVGKSSLVNFLVNRKALASVSPVPGHTTKFHFFDVNRARSDLPHFRLVDVPGLGYAEANQTELDSWRGFLQRYLVVRSSLRVVLHLIDSRHGITKMDMKIFEMVRDALRERNGKSDSFDYAIVLTKADKSNNLRTISSIGQVRRRLKELGFADFDHIPIVVTSTVDKLGRIELWQQVVSAMRQPLLDANFFGHIV